MVTSFNKQKKQIYARSTKEPYPCGYGEAKYRNIACSYSLLDIISNLEWNLWVWIPYGFHMDSICIYIYICGYSISKPHPNHPHLQLALWKTEPAAMLGFHSAAIGKSSTYIIICIYIYLQHRNKHFYISICCLAVFSTCLNIVAAINKWPFGDDFL